MVRSYSCWGKTGGMSFTSFTLITMIVLFSFRLSEATSVRLYWEFHGAKFAGGNIERKQIMWLIFEFFGVGDVPRIPRWIFAFSEFQSEFWQNYSPNGELFRRCDVMDVVYIWALSIFPAGRRIKVSITTSMKCDTFGAFWLNIVHWTFPPNNETRIKWQQWKNRSAKCIVIYSNYNLPFSISLAGNLHFLPGCNSQSRRKSPIPTTLPPQ